MYILIVCVRACTDMHMGTRLHMFVEQHSEDSLQNLKSFVKSIWNIK